MNPAPDVENHALAIDDRESHPDIGVALETSALYRLRASRAERIVAETRRVVATWQARARALDLPAAEIALVAPAFRVAAEST